MSVDYVIRPGERRDAGVIAAYNRAIAWETESLKLDPDTALRGVSRVFDDSKKGFYLVAQSGDTIIGQLMVTYEWSDWRDGWFWWVQSVYVRQDFRRNGIFRQLFETVVARARAAGDVVGLRLYVEPNNKKAQATYPGLGMHAPGYLVEELMLK